MKFRVGRILYLAFSHDETVMGFAFPKDWRDALASIDATEMRELVVDAWALVVPKRVAAAYAQLGERAPERE